MCPIENYDDYYEINYNGLKDFPILFRWYSWEKKRYPDFVKKTKLMFDIHAGRKYNGARR